VSNISDEHQQNVFPKHFNTSSSQHIIGHFVDDHPSQSLDWHKNLVFTSNWLVGTSKPNQSESKLQHRKIYMTITKGTNIYKTKLNETKV